MQNGCFSCSLYKYKISTCCCYSVAPERDKRGSCLGKAAGWGGTVPVKQLLAELIYSLGVNE